MMNAIYIVILIVLLIVISRQYKEAEAERKRRYKPYWRSDRGWDNDDILRYDPLDYDIVARDEKTNEPYLLYKGRLSDDPRTPVYTEEDVVSWEKYGEAHFEDGFTFDEGQVSHDYHCYFDVDFAFPTFSREWEAEKCLYSNGGPWPEDIRNYDLVDIRHLNKQYHYMKFKKGTCPRKWLPYLVTEDRIKPQKKSW